MTGNYWELLIELESLEDRHDKLGVSLKNEIEALKRAISDIEKLNPVENKKLYQPQGEVK